MPRSASSRGFTGAPSRDTRTAYADSTAQVAATMATATRAPSVLAIMGYLEEIDSRSNVDTRILRDGGSRLSERPPSMNTSCELRTADS